MPSPIHSKQPDETGYNGKRERPAHYHGRRPLSHIACNSIPTRDEPAAYAQALVQDANRLYDKDSRRAAIDHHSSRESVKGNVTSNLSRVYG